MRKYYLLLKTGDAELRAWKNLSAARKEKVHVLCEITRGRKKPNKNPSAVSEYNLESVLRSVENEFQNCRACVVDLTREPTLTSAEIETLGDPHNGYERWVECVEKLRVKNAKIKPTLIINPAEGDSFEKYRDAIFGQFDRFAGSFDLICYRVSMLHDSEFILDLEMLRERINSFTSSGNTFQIVLDFEYIRPATARLHSEFATQIIRSVRDIAPDAVIVSVGTSFPKNVTDIGDERRDSFRVEEVLLNAEINRLQNTPVEYGDYGSINPIRNDLNPPVGPHLRARVDFPTDHGTIFYYRVNPVVDKDTNKLLTPRSVMYKEAAHLVVGDHDFSFADDSWGYRKITEAAAALPEGSSPSFWISVRMELHICRQLDRLIAG